MGSKVTCPQCAALLCGVLAVGQVVRCPSCLSGLQIVSQPPAHRGDSDLRRLLVGIGVASAVVGVGVLAFKVVQAATDEVFDSVEFPASFRHDLIDDHVAAHGTWCPACDDLVNFDELSVDHIVALRNGGLTSRSNAAVMCRSCNSMKGAHNSPFDYVRGRRG
ncbi:MAG: HNH endonuclease signature motif containing protein [Polyangiaceae bacterium]